jgi:GTP-binding protein
VLADIPGIIEGAHRGVGLGHDFLRHIERTRVLINLVDGSSATPALDLRNLEEELECYDASLKGKPRIVAVNKIDLPEVRARMPQIREELAEQVETLHFISAATREGVQELMRMTADLLRRTETAPAEREVEAGFKVFRPRPLSVRKTRGDEDGEA